MYFNYEDHKENNNEEKEDAKKAAQEVVDKAIEAIAGIIIVTSNMLGGDPGKFEGEFEDPETGIHYFVHFGRKED